MFFLEFDTCDEAAAKTACTALLRYLEREVSRAVSDAQIESIYLELVSNVCKHGGRWARISVRWRNDGRPILEVSDDGPGLDLSQWRPPSRLAEHGRGLMIVSRLSKGFDVTPGPGGRGTTVHAVLPLRRFQAA